MSLIVVLNKQVEPAKLCSLGSGFGYRLSQDDGIRNVPYRFAVNDGIEASPLTAGQRGSLTLLQMSIGRRVALQKFAAHRLQP